MMEEMDATEVRNAAIVDATEAFLTAYMAEKDILALEGKLAEMMEMISPVTYCDSLSISLPNRSPGSPSVLIIGW